MAQPDISPEQLSFTVFALVVAGAVAFLAAVGFVFLT